MKSFVTLLLLSASLISCSHINSVGDGKTHLIRCHSWMRSDESCSKLATEICTGDYKVVGKESYWEFGKGPQRSITVVCKKD